MNEFALQQTLGLQFGRRLGTRGPSSILCRMATSVVYCSLPFLVSTF